MGKISSHSGRVNHGNHIDSPITFSESDLHQPSRDSPLISSPSFRFSSLKKHCIQVLATSREVKQKFLVIWEGPEPWCFLFHILFLSPPFSSYMNNAKDLVARGAMGEGFTQSPLPGAIRSEGKSSQDKNCSPIGSPVAGQRSCVNNHLYLFPVMDHRKIGSCVKVWAEKLC